MECTNRIARIISCAMKVLSTVPTVLNLSEQSLIVSNIHPFPNSWTRIFMNLVPKIVAESPVKARPYSVRSCKKACCSWRNFVYRRSSTWP